MKTKKNITIVKDLLLGIGAVVLMNGVLQLFVYPQLNKTLGADGFGNVLYLLGIIAIASMSFGLSANNTRLVIRNKYPITNGDFSIIMLTFSLVGVIIGFFAVKNHISGLGEYFAFSFVLILTTFRYYCDVEFRIKLDYEKYFIYYALLAVGYCAGILIYKFAFKSWYTVFFVGEAMAVLYVAVRGTILTRNLKRSNYTSKAFKSSTTLAVSYLLYNVGMNIDRIVLLNIISSEAVSQYYVVSLLGKTLAMLSGPLEGVIVSYLTKDNQTLTKKQYMKLVLIVSAVGAVFFALCCVATPIFIKLFYPNLYDTARHLTAIASLAQILCFTSTIFLTVILTLASEKYQFVVQLLYLTVLAAFAVPLTKASGVYGFAIAAVIGNLFRFILVIVIGAVKSASEKEMINQ